MPKPIKPALAAEFLLMPAPAKPPKVLKVCAIDSTAWILLKTQMDAMRDLGWTVGVACSDGPSMPKLREAGFLTHALPIARNTNLWSHAQSIWGLYRLMRRERYDVVHVHTPVASLVGRLAAKLARVPLVLYTAHGFYFHDEMPMAQRRRHVWLERAFGRLTDHLFTQSAEDAATAVDESIMPVDAVTTIGNGVLLERFETVPPEAVAAWRAKIGIPHGALVVGIVGRMVEEKGYREFFEAAQRLLSHRQDVAFLVVGSAAVGDRDGFQAEMTSMLADSDLAAHIYFTGHSDDVPALMTLMDVFALPSYREGMPRSIIEAMGCGKPVVATNIRGCREEVIDGETGYLIPLKDAMALAERLETLLDDPELRQAMGAAGQRRAREHFHERLVVDRLLKKIEQLLLAKGIATRETIVESCRPESALR